MNSSLSYYWEFIKTHKFISLLIFVSFVSALRVLWLPLFSDEITYSKIAQNIILHGRYALDGKPSTITPSLPFIIAFFYTKFEPFVGFVFARLLNLLFLFIGLKYLWLFLKKTKLKHEIIWAIMMLTIVNNNFVAWSLLLYPEAILFCFFWIFIYFLTKPVIEPRNIIFILFPFVALVLTRYVYAVFGVFLFYVFFNYLRASIKNQNYEGVKKIFIYSILCVIPLLFWVKYIYSLEKEIDTGLSYFSRFKNNEWLYNVKAGIGLVKHEDAGNINGIPAFITLFIPVTGLRNWILSIILLGTFIFGYVLKGKKQQYRILFIAILLVMLGLIFAGTGFSRYWLIMLPGFLLGFYMFLSSLRIKDSQFILLAKILAVIYVINELRLNVKILSNFF